MASDQATGGGGGCDFPMDAGGQEMLASFLWAVGEDAIGSRNGRAQPADVDDDDDDDEDNTSVDAMDGSQMHYASPTPAPEPAAAAPLPAQQAFPAQLPTPTAFAGHSPLPTAAIPSVAAFPLASESADVKLEGRDPAGPVPAPASAPAPLHQLPTANFNLPGMIPNPAGLDMFGHAMFNPLTAGLLPGMNHAALYGQAQMGNLALSQMGGLGLPPSANAFSRLLPLGMMPPSLPNPFAVGPQGAGSSSGEHARNNQRLQRKAESARVARVRKKHYVATLELENSELRAKLHALQNAQHRGEGMQQAASAVAAQQPAEQAHAQQQSDGTGVSAAERQAQSAMELKVQEMCDILQRHSIDRLTSDVNSLVEQFVANQRMRQRSINYHFNEITDLLDTGPQYKMAFWDALQARGPAHAVMDDGNAPSAAQPSASGDGGPGGPGGSSVRTGSQLLDLLVDELQMEPAQIDKLEACRKRCEEMQTSMLHCNQLVEQAREQVLYNIAASQQVMDNMRGVLTPQQVARFLVWVEKHKRSMEVFVHT